MSNHSGTYIVTDNTGIDGIINVPANVQLLVFKDVSVNLIVTSQAASIPTSDLNALIELYIAYFNRVPDANGLSYWITQFQAGATLEQIGDTFYGAAAQYGALTGYSANMSNADFVTTAYKNILSRSPPDAAGLDYWTRILDSGAITKSTLIRTFLAAAHSYAGDPNYGWVSTLLDNKIAVSKNFAVQQGLSYVGTDDAISKGMMLFSVVTATDTSIANGLIQALTGYTPASSDLVTPAQASRMLSQASFGANQTEIATITSLGFDAWLDGQFQKGQKRHRDYMDTTASKLTNGISGLNQNNFFESFWQQAITGDDQLRQRVAFALSQIFVVSFQDSTVANYPRGVASFYDVLETHAFGNYRNLLEAVTLHPMMGIYLTSLRNQKESGTRVPDENYAREVMQLFTIGLYQLNQDGSYVLNNGKPVETYSNADISGLAKVFTGWSWAGPDKSDTRFYGGNADPNRDWMPMQSYPKFHSISEKKFLGVTIAAQSSADPEGDLKLALDTLFNHPNVGPFISRQLIQRLVSSNPSPQYISRVAAVFANNGQGVRGDLKAVIKAILLDTEARTDALTNNAGSGKLREPVLRLANWMRAFNAKSTSTRFLMTNLDDPLTALGQTPIRSPSVFNFYRPGYVPPNSSIASAGLVAPEMQITGETSVVGYLNFMRNVIANGTGTSRDIQPDYKDLIALSVNPPELLDQVNLLLLAGQMSANLRGQILSAVNSVSIPTNNASSAETARKNRVYLSIFLTMASPEYLVQK
ncbi:MAG: DUF1800 family protein [Burkholderiales bacterium]|nr:DUF1800 family protein [Burkholderiales bacterium]